MPETLPAVVNQTRIICTRENWLRMDREDAVKKECKKEKETYFYSNGKVKPKKDRPKISALTKRIINRVILQDE